ncbi:MAG: hypothetical protein QGG64_29295, partial [Candidatus Latescibacteria bacterium]|nr:hypothetical protein [Candidatus Latescibacterota bacterium]
YLEVLFNDNSPVLHVDRGQRPVTGELAAKCESVVVDAFNHKPIGGGTLSDKKGPFSQGTPLTLRLPACETQIGPYTDSTGQAGIRSLQSPFRISPGEPPEFFAMGKVGAGLEALTGGESSIIAIGHAFLGGKPLPTNSGVGKITVVG